MFSKPSANLEQQLHEAQRALLEAFRQNNQKRVDELAAKIDTIKLALRRTSHASHH